MRQGIHLGRRFVKPVHEIAVLALLQQDKVAMALLLNIKHVVGLVRFIRTIIARREPDQYTRSLTRFHPQAAVLQVLCAASFDLIRSIEYLDNMLRTLEELDKSQFMWSPGDVGN